MKKDTLILSMLLTVGLISCAGMQENASNQESSKISSEGEIQSDDSYSLPSIDVSSMPSVNLSENDQETDESIEAPSTEADDNYNPDSETIVLLKDNNSSITNNNGGVVVQNNDIYVTKGGIYRFSGTLSNGKIIVNLEETEQAELGLDGVDISCDYGAPIGIFNGDKVEISAKNESENYIKDVRTTLEDTQDGSNSAIYSKIDTKIKGRGYLNVLADYNNGIGVSKDLEIKNATLEIVAPNNAIKGQNSITVENGIITAISTLGDAMKTSNSNLSSKGNQKGNITILDGTINLYSACDGVDAAYDATIGGTNTEPTINIFTDKYSQYSKEVTTTSETEIYFALSNNSRPGTTSIDINAYYFAAYFTLNDGNSQFVKLNTLNSKAFGGNRTNYFSCKKPTEATMVQFFAFSNNKAEMTIDNFDYMTEELSLPISQDTYKISSIQNKVMYGSWTNYSTNSGMGPGGMGPGGMDQGNPNGSEYSCKGIKADNAIEINSGIIEVKAHDDAISAKNDTLLGTNVYGLGNLNIKGGQLKITTDDDGLHADNSLTISGGITKVLSSYEGIEATRINITGGTNQIFALDDGINGSGNNASININGGLSYFDANGDVIDSNGTIEMSGGVVFATGSSGGGNGLLDFDRTFTISGGFFFGFGGSDMAQAPSSSNNVTIKKNTSYSVMQNNYINVMDGNNIVASMKVTRSNLRYYVLGYDQSYGSSLEVTNSTSLDVTLVDGLYYIAA